MCRRGQGLETRISKAVEVPNQDTVKTMMSETMAAFKNSVHGMSEEDLNSKAKEASISCWPLLTAPILSVVHVGQTPACVSRRFVIQLVLQGNYEAARNKLFFDIMTDPQKTGRIAGALPWPSGQGADASAALQAQ